MFKCRCRRMKCDEGSDAWNNLRISHIHVCLKNLRQHAPRKKNMEFAKVRRKNLFLAKMTFSRWKNLEQPSYIILVYCICQCSNIGCCVSAIPTWLEGMHGAGRATHAWRKRSLVKPGRTNCSDVEEGGHQCLELQIEKPWTKDTWRNQESLPCWSWQYHSLSIRDLGLCSKSQHD